MVTNSEVFKKVGGNILWLPEEKHADEAEIRRVIHKLCTSNTSEGFALNDKDM